MVGSSREREDPALGRGMPDRERESEPGGDGARVGALLDADPHGERAGDAALRRRRTSLLRSLAATPPDGPPLALALHRWGLSTAPALAAAVGHRLGERGDLGGGGARHAGRPGAARPPRRPARPARTRRRSGRDRAEAGRQKIGAPLQAR